MKPHRRVHMANRILAFRSHLVAIFWPKKQKKGSHVTKVVKPSPYFWNMAIIHVRGTRKLTVWYRWNMGFNMPGRWSDTFRSASYRHWEKKQAAQSWLPHSSSTFHCDGLEPARPKVRQFQDHVIQPHWSIQFSSLFAVLSRLVIIPEYFISNVHIIRCVHF